MGHVGSALNFDGTNDFVNTGFFDPSPEAITIATWVKWRGPSAQNQTIMAKGEAVTSTWRWMFQVNSNGKLVFRNSASSATSVGTSLRVDTWEHVAVTKANNLVTFFVNGIAVGTGTLAFGASANGKVTIGGLDSISSSQCLKGALDDIRLYNRALGLDEVVLLAAGSFVADESSGDLDLNGLPDDWEIFNFGGLRMLGIAAHDDSDGDGSPNSAEYVAGTDPLDPLSGPALQVSRTSGQLQVHFTAIQALGAGYATKTRFYTLEYCDDLDSGLWSQVPGEVAIVAQNQTVNHEASPSANGSGFYRLQIGLQ
jgi:hypothetical protein